LHGQPQWAGKQQTMQYLASCKDISNVLSALLEGQDDPLQRNLLLVSRWLREAPKAARWRSSVMRQAAMLIQNETLSLGLRARFLTSLVLSNDPGVPILLRQLLTNPNENVRILAILGCGMLRDSKAYSDLAGLLNDSSLRVSQASLFALDALGTETARQDIAAALIQGSEPMRRTAAELLADDPEEGHETLKECLEMDDLVARRAAIFGLARIKQPWSIQTLEKLQIEDGQWVIRNAASQVLEDSKQLDPAIPLPSGEITEAPWLLAYAAKLGMGISPGKPAMNLVVESLKDGSLDQRYAALDYLTRKGDSNVVPQVYQLLYGANEELREAAFNTLWHIAAAGVELPPPAQFGLGS
ncbi:MAG: HEAT repeat domain-containing protein, partial [Omnitrophica WOR_2 bacterium]